MDYILKSDIGIIDENGNGAEVVAKGTLVTYIDDKGDGWLLVGNEEHVFVINSVFLTPISEKVLTDN